MLRATRFSYALKDPFTSKISNKLNTSCVLLYKLPISEHLSPFSKRSYCIFSSRYIVNHYSTNYNEKETALLNPKPLSMVQQYKYFSFQNSVQSFLATQAGFFKTISESTPVEYCQKYFLFVHDFTCLPWWASIILSTVMIRAAVTLPLAIYQQIIFARLENLKLELPEIANELKRETAIAIKLYNWDEKMAKATFSRSMRKQWNNLVIRDNCHPLKTTVLLWVQIPLWISLSVSLRNIVYMLPVTDINAQLRLAELSVGGLSFIPNLTVPDSSWILPVFLGILNLTIIEVQNLSRDPTIQNSPTRKVFTNIFRILSLIMIPISASVPSCLTLYWTTSSAYGLAQNLFLMSPKVKRLFRIPQTSVEVKEPYKRIIDNLKEKLKLV